MPNLNNLTTQDLQWGTANWSGQAYKEGLKMVWNSATSLSITSGAAYIPSLAKNLPSPTAITLAGLVLSASTFYHLYLYSNAGAPAVECVTTAPSATYYGIARTKTGDTSRRYIGSVLTDSSGNLWYFQQFGNKIEMGWGSTASLPQRALNNGNATTATTVSLAASVPVTATAVNARLLNNDASVGARIANSLVPGATGATGAGTNFLYAIAAASNITTDIALDNSQALLYWFTGTPTGFFFIDVFGYIYES